jgi:hypothetical protein
MGEQPRSGIGSRDRTRGRRRFDYRLTATTAELRPHVANDLETLRDILEHFRDIFAELA